MKKYLFSFFIIILAGALMGSFVLAKQSNEVVIYKAEMKSKSELIKDAKAGLKDSGLSNINIETYAVDSLGNENKELKLTKHYTVQKLKEVKKGDTIETDYLVFAIVYPEDYDKYDHDHNPGYNFEQHIWGWFQTTTKNNLEYARGVRYEAEWELMDPNSLTIQNGEFTAVTEGLAYSTGLYINESNPSYYYPPVWGTRYVKTVNWDYVCVSDQIGDAGAALRTDYSVRSSTGTLYSLVYVGTIPWPTY